MYTTITFKFNFVNSFLIFVLLLAFTATIPLLDFFQSKINGSWTKLFMENFTPSLVHILKTIRYTVYLEGTHHHEVRYSRVFHLPALALPAFAPSKPTPTMFHRPATAYRFPT